MLIGEDVAVLLQAMPVDLEIKGAAYYALVAVAEREYGRALVDRAIARLPGALQDALNGETLVSGAFHPVATYRALLHGLHDEGVDTRRAGALSVERDMTTIYRVMLRALTPGMVIRQSPRLFGLFYRGGRVKLLETRSTGAVVDFSECHGFDSLMWTDYFGGSEHLLALAGAKDVTTVVKSGGEGATMVAEISWA